MDSKSAEVVASRHEDDYELEEKSPMKGSDSDQHDMQVLGKTQELNVSRYRHL